jgi:hypothetical protein
MSEESNEEYTTRFGNFVEDPSRPGVFLAEEIDQSELVVPASVSRTGQDIPLNVSPTTVFITPDNGERALPYEESIEGTPEGSGNSTSLDRVAYFNNLSLVASFANSSGYPSQIQRAGVNPTSPVIDPLQPVRIALAGSNAGIGPFALVTNNNGGGIINLGDGDTDMLVARFVSVPNIASLNLTQSEIDGLGSFVVGHEIKHLNDGRVAGRSYEDWETYRAEVNGDHDTLNTYFNDDFAQLVMDMRALGSLNNFGFMDVEMDDHATHIWSEEFRTGVMPTEEQANKIMAAPNLINSELESRLDSDQDIIESMYMFPAERYIYLATLHAEGAFAEQQSENEYVNEYLDKYIDAAERRYPSEQIDEASQRVLMRQASELVYDAEPDVDLSEGDVADKLRDDPAYYYANMKVLRENGTFDSIPHANEIIDRRLAQIEQENPELIKNIDMNVYRERYKNDEAPTPSSVPTPTLPSTGLAPPAAPSMPSL